MMTLGQELLKRSVSECWRADSGEKGRQGTTITAGHDERVILLTVSPQLDGRVPSVAAMLHRRGITLTKLPDGRYIVFFSPAPVS